MTDDRETTGAMSLTGKSRAYYMAHCIERAVVAVGGDGKARRRVIDAIAEAIQQGPNAGAVHERLMAISARAEAGGYSPLPVS